MDGTPNSGDLRLEVTAGKATGFDLVVDDRLVIGRNSAGPGRLADDPEISRDHAEIARTPGGDFTIRDLASTNGTYVNGARLTTPAVLKPGDEVEVGATKLVVSSAPVRAAPPPADVDVRAETMTGRAPPTEPQPAAGGRPLEVRLKVDFERDSAELSIDGNGDPIRLVLDNGQWRLGGGGG
jgi:pSer/pThr/pTyr-binding forkhead associated (FHA) protein